MRTISLLIVLPVLLYCCRKIVNGPWAFINAKYEYINDTEYTVTLTGCGFDEMGPPHSKPLVAFLTIAPGEALTVHQSDARHPPDVNIDNFIIFGGGCYAVYGDSLACDLGSIQYRSRRTGLYGINNMADYERRVEVSENNFEFTYRFTQQTMQEAERCPQTATYIYVNKHGEDLVLRVEESLSARFAEYDLKPEDSITFVILSYSWDAFPFHYIHIEDQAISGDKVVLRYEDNQCVAYKRDGSNGETFTGDGVFDLIKYENYSQSLVNQRKYTLRYEIDEKDHAVATDCPDP